jgi:superfamily II DNA or RNA helicase
MSAQVKGKANCITCTHKAFQPLTVEAFTAHLLGEDERCRDVLGAYPLDGDDCCSFILADFDGKKKAGDAERSDALDETIGGKGALETASAFRQTCLKNHVPVYLEISRSGEGYHVWLFFSKRVPALLARRLFTKLWTMTMEDNPGMDFSAYDRFFPSQDILPGSGLQGSLGNLVALPFQGRAGRNMLTLFLDTSFTPYPDQWEFLSSAKRFTKDDLAAALKRLTAIPELGELALNEDDEPESKPWEKRKPAPKLKQSDFIGSVEVVRANMLHLNKAALSARAQNRIKRLAAFSNPEFYRKQARRLSTYNEPRVISTHGEDEHYLSIPRGAEPALVELLKVAGVSYTIADKTTEGRALDVEFLAELRDDQPLAAAALLQHDNGVLSAGTGFGKTVVAAQVIAERKVNTLVLVHNQPLLSQWKAAMETLLCVSNEPPKRFTSTGREREMGPIGEYHGKKKNLSGLVDIAMIQALGRQGEVEDFVKDYGMVIVDEAHHTPAASFERVLQHANAKYIYGLTATPLRKDRRTPILFLECGPIRFKTDAKELAARRPFEHYLLPRFTNLQRTSARDEQNFSALLSDIVSNSERNQLIVQDVIAALEQGRKPIILTDRTAHVHELAEALSGSCENVITLLGTQSAKLKREAYERLATLPENARFVIIATGKLAGEGFDYPRLDTLFLAVPISWKGRIAQYAGRLHRVYEGKNDVHIYDYVDANIPMLDNMYHTRIKGYKAIGYKVLINSDTDTVATTPGFIYDKDDYWE